MNLAKTGDMIVSRVADVLRPYGLSPAGGLILSMLADAGEPLTPGQLRAGLLVKGPTVTGLLDSLEKTGLVRRRPDGEDRRRVWVELTGEGRVVADSFRPAVHRAQRPWLECLTEAERRALIGLLGRVQQHLAGSDPEPT